MKRVFFTVALIVFIALTTLVAGSAVAQEVVPAVEVFGGYSLLKLGASIDDIKGLQSDIPTVGGDGVGWNINDSSFFLSRGASGSVAFNINEYFGIETAAHYHQGNVLEGSFGLPSPELPGTIVQTPFVFSMKNVSALAGPRLTFRREKATVFAHALAGLDYWRLTGDFIVAGEHDSFSDNSSGFGVAIGGGFDVNVNERIAVRVIQADYYLTRHVQRQLNNMNLSFGIVFKIGEASW
ncbi:MAG: porin family protein [Acidobacteriota bacterium]|jgi:opacity protein-like surface antigen|nr:porin family protein [Acidobacteriota bacterium]